MGKYVGYALLIIVTFFVLEWFQIVDVPYLEIPNWSSGKHEMVKTTENSLDQLNK